MTTISGFAFPAPPVYSRDWDDRAWLRYARRYGTRTRRGPAPSVEMWNGLFAPFSGEYDSKGAPLYACDRAFRSMFGR